MLADDPGVVDDEGGEGGDEGVLDHGDGEQPGDADVGQREDGRKDDEGELGEGNSGLTAELLILEVQWVRGRSSSGDLGVDVIALDKGRRQLLAHRDLK